jgi:hypothetical protein
MKVQNVKKVYENFGKNEGSIFVRGGHNTFFKKDYYLSDIGIEYTLKDREYLLEYGWIDKKEKALSGKD